MILVADPIRISARLAVHRDADDAVFVAQWNSALPQIFTGLKISLPRGISSAVVAEFLAADAGLGFYIENSRDQADTVGIFTGVVVVTIYVLVLNGLLSRLQLRSLAWRPVDREMQI